MKSWIHIAINVGYKSAQSSDTIRQKARIQVGRKLGYMSAESSDTSRQRARLQMGRKLGYKSANTRIQSGRKLRHKQAKKKPGHKRGKITRIYVGKTRIQARIHLDDRKHGHI